MKRQYFFPFALFLSLCFYLLFSAEIVSAHYQRIISLYPGHTENIVSLHGEQYLIGISRSDTYPPSITGKPRFSARDGAERFITVQPDCILIRPMLARAYPQLFEKLRLAGIEIISLQPGGAAKNSDDLLADLFHYWREIGAIIHREKEAEAMVDIFRQSINQMKKSTTVWQKKHAEPPPKVYFETMHSKSRTIATNSIAAFILQVAGGINIANDALQVRTTNIAYYPKEKLLAKGEMVDIFIAQKGRMNAINKEIIEKEPGYMAIRAVREKEIYIIPEEIISRPTLRILEGMKLLHSILYPEVPTQ